MRSSHNTRYLLRLSINLSISYKSHDSLLTLFRPYSSATGLSGVPFGTDGIKKFLDEKKIVSEQGYTCFSFVCPAVPKSKLHGKATDENHKIFVNTNTGAFVCHHCLQAGDYASFQNLMNSVSHGKSVKSCSRSFEDDKEGSNVNKVDVYSGFRKVAELSKDEFTAMCDRHRVNKSVLQTTLANYECHVSYPDLAAVMFPYYGPAGNSTLKLRGVKTVSSASDGQITSRMIRCAPRNLFGLFGWNLLSKRTSEIILTANELDAMALYQSVPHSPSSSVAVLSLPCGYQTLPQHILPLLEPFRKITIWLGSELSVWQAAKQFARKLGEKRCHLVRPSDEHSGAHDALSKGLDTRNIISGAHPAAHKAIVSFNQLRQDVLAELSQSEQVAGIRWRKYTRLNEILKGHRRGELTIFTGPTGAGKTTFISDYSLDLAMQGVATLWGSFEISNVRLCKLMLTQFAGRKLVPGVQLKQDFDLFSDQFEQLPIHFLTFHGSESLRRVVEAMTHAVYVHDIVHVVIDNLQFMMDVESDRTLVDRFQKQDQIIAALRRFATQQQCHVTLVIHPRKEAEGQPLTNSSIFGGVKAVQEADNVMLLQPSVNASPLPNFSSDNRSGANFIGSAPRSFPSTGSGSFSSSNTKCIQITKNRFDGELGKLHLRFNRDSLTFEQVYGARHSTDANTATRKPHSEFTMPTPIFASSVKPVPNTDDLDKSKIYIESKEPSKLSATYSTVSASVDALLEDLNRSST